MQGWRNQAVVLAMISTLDGENFVRILVLTALLGLAAHGLPAMAQPANPLPAAASDQGDPDAPFRDVIRSIEESSNLDRSMALVADAMAEQFAIASPELALAERRYPGMGRAMANAMIPILKSRDARLRDIYLPRQIAVIRANLTASEAADVARFYRSDLGRKMLGGVVDSFDSKQMLSDAVNTGSVGAASFKADTNRAVAYTVGKLTDSDLLELEREFKARPGLMKLKPLGAALGELRVAAENEPMTPEEDKQIETAVIAAMERHIAAAKSGK